jgi:hypothetical protein
MCDVNDDVMLLFFLLTYNFVVSVSVTNLFILIFGAIILLILSNPVATIYITFCNISKLCIFNTLNMSAFYGVP